MTEHNENSVWIMVLSAFLGVIIIAALFGMATRARCAWCPSYTCYSTAGCGGDCVCLKAGSSLGGHCYSAD